MTTDSTDRDPEWERLPRELRGSIASAWRLGVPPAASAIYGRWWQLETWLRSLVYVELKAAFGPAWADHLPTHSAKRQEVEQTLQHMSTADAQARLAYADVGALFTVIEEQWPLFEPALFAKSIWMGRAEELRHIRNRIGHCRRPHADDLARVEQTLRDLEPGAFQALSAFNRHSRPDAGRDDPLVAAWVRGEHEDAVRLIEHADRQYETRFDLMCSRRPWSERVSGTVPISGARGYLWHAQWYCRGDRALDLRAFWDGGMVAAHPEAILFVCASDSSSLEVSFSALEDPNVVADSIGNCFDHFLMRSHRGRRPEDEYPIWAERYADLDPRLQVGGAWAIVDDSTTPISIFGA